MSDKFNEMKELWQNAHKQLISIHINHNNLQCTVASCYADSLIVSVRGVIQHLKDRDNINAFKIIRTILESLVKFKCIVKDSSYLEKFKNDSLSQLQSLIKRAQNPEEGIGLEVLKSNPHKIDLNKKYLKVNFKELCKEIGWIQQYNLIYWYSSEISHVSLNQIFSCFKQTEKNFELIPYGESDHENHYDIILKLMIWFAKQFLLVLKDFEKIQRPENFNLEREIF